MLPFEKLNVLVLGGLALGAAPPVDCEEIRVRAGAGSESIGVPPTVEAGWPPIAAALAEIADIPINPATAAITVASAKVRFIRVRLIWSDLLEIGCRQVGRGAIVARALESRIREDPENVTFLWL
jgi:hypothetical protein